MAGSKLRLSNEVQALLKDVDLESLSQKLEALGVRSLQDLALVDDADLVRWGLTTIERRRFFGHVRRLLGDGGESLMPPSALTTTPLPGKERAAAGHQKRRPETTSSVGPARLDELVGRGSAEYQVPRLCERLLAATGPLDISDLALRAGRAAPALSQGYDPDEWPQFVEACIRGYGRLMVEDGILQGDRPVVSICSTVLFSASEEVVADTASWVRVVTCLATPSQVSVVACLCRSSREVADGPEVWSKLLARWYPKATLLNPDWVAQTELEKRLEQALENDYALAALTKRLQPDMPLDIGDLLRALPQQTTPKALVKFMSCHPENFKQSPDGKMFCVSRSADDLKLCKDWRTVNPFQTPPLPKSLDALDDVPKGPGQGTAPTPAPMGRPKELKQQQAQVATGSSDANEAPREVCQKLDPKVAFRLYHTGLLSQSSQQSKRGTLEAWEYYTESNSKCTMAAGDLLDLAESRVKAVRSNDPAVVHELVAQTIEGMVFKVPFGYWHRRVKILNNALSASQLRVGREQRKKCERKLLEFMEWVKKERGFGYYQCDSCGSRWKSGFSYEEIQQQCLTCGSWQRPYRIQDLESAQERESRERGEVVNSRRGDKTAINTRIQPAIAFEAPVIEHTREDAARGQKRPFQRMDAGEGWAVRQGQQRVRQVSPPRNQPRTVPARVAFLEEATAAAAAILEALPPDAADPPARSRSPRRTTNTSAPAALPNSAQAAVPAEPEDPMQAALRKALGLEPEVVAPAAPRATSSTTAGSSGGYVPGRGGFFSRASASGGAPAAPSIATSNGATSGIGTSPAAATSSYKPGAGGFFANRRAASAADGATPGSVPAAGADPSPSTSSSTPASTGVVSAAASSRAAAAAPSAPAAPAPASATTAYKPGGGGFFANRRAAAAPDGPSSTPATTQAASSGGSGDAATPLASEPSSSSSVGTYKAGGGGFFASRRAAAPGASESSAVSPSDSASVPPVSAASVTVSSASVDVPTPSSSVGASKYTPGGGGFFANRRPAAAASPAPQLQQAAAPAPEATMSDAEGAPPSSSEDIATSLGLSVEEALAMGLIGSSCEASLEEPNAKRGKTNDAEDEPGNTGRNDADMHPVENGPEMIIKDKERDEAEKAAKKAAADNAAKAAITYTPRAEAEKAAAAKQKHERLAEEKVEAEKAAIERAEAARLAEEKAEAEKVAAAKLSMQKAAAARSAATDKVAADKAEADKVASDKTMQQSSEKEMDKAAGASSSAAPAPKAAQAEAGDVEMSEMESVAEGSDESLVDAINAVVVFKEADGSVKVIAAQATDVSYLVSDDVFWPLLRRLAAETAALQTGSTCIDDSSWASAPASSEDSVCYAESRGYHLPGGLAAPAADSKWRRHVLIEVATELMLERITVGRGFDLPALAGPSGSFNSSWEERPGDSLEGLTSKVDAASGERVAIMLLGDLETSTSSSSEAAAAAPDDLNLRLSNIAGTVVSQRDRWVRSSATSSGPALQGGWSLLQEMGIREAALALREEYAVRRQILLRRLDVTVQAMCVSLGAASQRRAADVLSRMWAGWRRTAGEAPPLSEWSALAAAQSMLGRATSARVSGPSTRTNSKVKSFRIGQVPDRGGVPEGYLKKGNPALQASAAKTGAASSRAPKSAVTVIGGASGSTSSGSAAHGSPAAASSVSVGDPSAAGDGVPARLTAKPSDKKGTQVGARSTNLNLRNEDRAQKRKEREEGKTNTYYEALGHARPRGGQG